MTALAPAASAVVSSDAPRFVEGLFAAARLGDAGRPMREVAVALVEAGWPVLPCHPIGKSPLLEGGFKGRSSNLHLVERWWGRQPQATVGIVPADGGLVALDVDSPKALAALRVAGLLPSGLLDALKARAPDADLGSEYGLIVATGGKSPLFEARGRRPAERAERRRVPVRQRLRHRAGLPRSKPVPAPGSRRSPALRRRVGSCPARPRPTGDRASWSAARTRHRARTASGRVHTQYSGHRPEPLRRVRPHDQGRGR